MTTWGRDTLRGVIGLRSTERHSYDDLAIARVDINELVRGSCSRRLQEAARTYAVDLDLSDVQFTQDEDEADEHTLHRTVTIAARWLPSVATVRLLGGGERDGVVLTVSDVRQPLLVAVQEAMPTFAQPDATPAPIGIRTLEFRLSGWSPEDRLWIMCTDPREWL